MRIPMTAQTPGESDSRHETPPGCRWAKRAGTDSTPAQDCVPRDGKHDTNGRSASLTVHCRDRAAQTVHGRSRLLVPSSSSSRLLRAALRLKKSERRRGQSGAKRIPKDLKSSSQPSQAGRQARRQAGRQATCSP